jgi:DNA-binding LacI/PurR family transcriptional regulator
MATMRDVADLAGVSIATVSFTVNNTKPVSPATRARVEKAMDDLGFRPNEVARALASRRSRILALLYPALQHRFGDTSSRFFTSAARAANERGYNLILSPVSNDSAELGELTTGGLVAGVMLMEVQMDDSRVDRLLSSRTPFLLIGRNRDPSALDYVDIDFENTVKDSLAYLRGLGHTHIALVTGNTGNSEISGYGPVVRTTAAFAAGMAAAGVAPVMVSCDETPRAGRESAAHLLDASPQTTAVIVMNEHAAFGLVSGFTHRGIRVPEDMSILSISSSPDMAAMSDPELTLMASPGIALGRMAVEALIDKLEGHAGQLAHSLIACTYTPGQSTAAARTG